MVTGRLDQGPAGPRSDLDQQLPNAVARTGICVTAPE
jgi:hypothetical protein